jgi:hypothetical protein
LPHCQQTEHVELKKIFPLATLLANQMRCCMKNTTAQLIAAAAAATAAQQL